MKLLEIRAWKEKLVFTFEGAQEGGKIKISARVPLVCGPKDDSFVEGRIVYEKECIIADGKAEIDRYAGKIDLLVYRFDCGCDGVCYVTDVEPEVARLDTPRPTLPLKSISSYALMEDFADLGMHQSVLEPNQADLMVAHDGEDAEPYEYDGKTYFMKKSAVAEIDEVLAPQAQQGIAVTMPYFNSSFFIGEKADQEIVDIIQHPGYDYDYSSNYIGAFNLRTEEGFGHFCACTDYLLNRYTRPDRKYGWAMGFVMGNEVTSQYVWGNAGEMTCAEYMHEYTEVMRIAWLLSRKYWTGFSVYTCFDQYFAGRHEPNPLRFYGMKECLEEILACSLRDGNFPWGVAFHPYPENLSYPDFWNDRGVNWSFETGKITFKNIEVMPAFLSQPQFLYRGQMRHMALTEQGFNSREDADYTLEQGKYGYVLAYQKIKKLQNFDIFTHHGYVDNPGEFGLNLGIRYYGGGAFNEKRYENPGPRKPICEAIAAMDTDREEAMVAEARAYIGEKIWDYMMNPPEVAETIDHSKGGLNLPGQGNRKGKKDKKEETKANFDT